LVFSPHPFFNRGLVSKIACGLACAEAIFNHSLKIFVHIDIDLRVVLGLKTCLDRPLQVLVLVAASRDYSMGHVLGVRGAGRLGEKLLDGPLDEAISLDEGFASVDRVLTSQVLKLLNFFAKVFVAACFVAHN
jgi:hypothetical protein